MGLTIHYQLSLKNASLAQVRDKIIALRNVALQLPCVRINELTELQGEACYFDQENLDDTHIFLKLRALDLIEVAIKGFSSTNPKYIIGFAILPGKGSESAAFGLATHTEITDENDWMWMGFCKTQYASNPEYGGLENFLKCHLMIVKMLDEAQKLGITCEVTDESGYWDNRNIEELAGVIDKHNMLMAAFTGKVTDDLEKSGINSVQAPIFDYPNFEYLEAKGNQVQDL
ncbi:hypothetical protein [Iningainema tapete]|uniref:Uncharacterized protein n=1 Tax=Iningainema tapete BLCC-T55 TaxID=2748662 RepID=A0A8J7CBU9_9CYAN|nr:hypothetical protein [Iningainema tapete]MBD2778756.1 hypothetical protein [Iningainema tapete BLCC-T55]